MVEGPKRGKGLVDLKSLFNQFFECLSSFFENLIIEGLGVPGQALGEFYDL